MSLATRRQGFLIPIIFVCSVLVLAALVIFGVFFLREWQVRPGKTGGEQPVASVSAADLFAEYKTNEIAADQVYGGRVIKVSGEIDRIGKSIGGGGYVELVASSPHRCVRCSFVAADLPGLSSLRPGQWLVVRGVVAGKIIGEPHLKWCRVVTFTSQP